MALLTNNRTSPYDLWTLAAWVHIPVGHTVEADITAAQATELKSLGFAVQMAVDTATKPKTTKAEITDTAKD